MPIFSALPDILNCVDGVNYAMIGNGYCNDETNNADCNYDGGDCCMLNVNSEHCTECKCYFQENCLAGVHPLVGNGICNDEANNGACSFDGGDCCLSIPNTDNCSECRCFATGVITSPGYPEDYAKGLNVSWIIKVPIEQLVEVRVTYFKIGNIPILSNGTKIMPW